MKPVKHRAPGAALKNGRSFGDFAVRQKTFEMPRILYHKTIRDHIHTIRLIQDFFDLAKRVSSVSDQLWPRNWQVTLFPLPCERPRRGGQGRLTPHLNYQFPRLRRPILLYLHGSRRHAYLYVYPKNLPRDR